jgi:peptidoglycan L-alanyl-D-glutamate endopeptidase CwlK
VSRSLDDLRPIIRPKVDAFLASVKSAGTDLLITCTKRTLEEQAALYAQGRTTAGSIVTNAKPGTSAHNYGLAIDVVPIVNGKPDWSFNALHPSAVWMTTGYLGRLAGLQWFGTPDSPYIEGCHFQMPDWKHYID